MARYRGTIFKDLGYLPADIGAVEALPALMPAAGIEELLRPADSGRGRLAFHDDAVGDPPSCMFKDPRATGSHVEIKGRRRFEFEGDVSELEVQLGVIDSHRIPVG